MAPTSKDLDKRRPEVGNETNRRFQRNAHVQSRNCLLPREKNSNHKISQDHEVSRLDKHLVKGSYSTVQGRFLLRSQRRTSDETVEMKAGTLPTKLSPGKGKAIEGCASVLSVPLASVSCRRTGLESAIKRVEKRKQENRRFLESSPTLSISLLLCSLSSPRPFSITRIQAD